VHSRPLPPCPPPPSPPAQCREFLANDIHTGWLDSRIASDVRSERPPWHLAVVAGAVVKSLQHIATEAADYCGFLAKGQLPPASVSLVHFDHELVMEGCKYRVQVRVGAAAVAADGCCWCGWRTRRASGHLGTLAAAITLAQRSGHACPLHTTCPLHSARPSTPPDPTPRLTGCRCPAAARAPSASA
jgi:hypothetical protein